MTTAVLSQIAALQAAVAAEHAAIYGYGVVGAHLTETARDDALDDLDAHLVVRDRLTDLLTSLGETPRAAKAAYQLPFAVTDAVTARQLATELEQGCAGAAWDLVAAGAAGSATRALAITVLSSAALRAAQWGARQALPGQPAPAP